MTDVNAIHPDPRFALGQSVGYAAFTWGYPLVETIRTCRLQTTAGDAAGVAWAAPIDRIKHLPRAATAADRDIVTPANDLLYSTAWINLANGPRLLHVPARAAHNARYFVLALYDAFTNNFANPGLRESAGTGETLLLVGPAGLPAEYPTHDLRVIECPTPLVWLIGRVVVGDADDWPAAQALQAEIRLAVPAGTDNGAVPVGVAHWQGATEDTLAALAARPDDADLIADAFFNHLCRALTDQPIPAADQGLAAWLAQGGLLPGSHFDMAQLATPLRQGLRRGLQDAARQVELASRSRRARPWATNFHIGRYGTNYMVRALTAYKGLGALAAEEALYCMGDFDADGQSLDGRHRYQLRFAAEDMPPVEGFWSLTLYAADRFLHPNALQRHAIGDRTPGLRRDSDGGLTLDMSHTAPADAANWLPAPAGGFYLILRLYVPRPESRSWGIPPLRRLCA